VRDHVVQVPGDVHPFLRAAAPGVQLPLVLVPEQPRRDLGLPALVVAEGLRRGEGGGEQQRLTADVRDRPVEAVVQVDVAVPDEAVEQAAHADHGRRAEPAGQHHGHEGGGGRPHPAGADQKGAAESGHAQHGEDQDGQRPPPDGEHQPGQQHRQREGQHTVDVAAAERQPGGYADEGQGGAGQHGATVAADHRVTSGVRPCGSRRVMASQTVPAVSSARPASPTTVSASPATVGYGPASAARTSEQVTGNAQC
jgi:hypothetical protein